MNLTLYPAAAFMLFAAAAAPLSRAAQQAEQAAQQRFQFHGLRRIPESTVRAILQPHASRTPGPGYLRSAVQVLDRTGWFEFIQVFESVDGGPVFVLRERPFLSGVEFRGMRSLNAGDIPALLREAGADLPLARPVDPLRVHRAAQVMTRALQGMGFAEARVAPRFEPADGASVRAVFEIVEGPYLPVVRVQVLPSGTTAVSAATLKRHMADIQPDAWLARLRKKNVYTGEKLQADAVRIEHYLREQGYPLARVGAARVRVRQFRRGAWWPWPRSKIQPGLSIEIPVHEGPRFTFSSFAVRDQRGNVRDELLLASPLWKAGMPYAQAKVEELRAHLQRALHCQVLRCAVHAETQVDPRSETAHVTFQALPAGNTHIRRVAFHGQHRFPDSFYRRRLGLAEGELYQAEKLRAGLAAIARDGFVKPVRPEDVVSTRVSAEELDLSIRVGEAGRQRVSLVGGASTVGLAYNLFNLLGGEELLTGHLEGGPQSLQIMLYLARRGLLQNRAALGFSLFHNLLRPQLPGSRGRRLFTSATTGLTQSFTLWPTATQALTLQYQYSSDTLSIPAAALPSAAPQRTHFSKSELALQWHRDTGETRVSAGAAVAGGRLGGAQDLLRFSGEAAALRRDLLSHGRSQWALRSLTTGVLPAPWSDPADVPPSALLYPGGDIVRGLRPGELVSPATPAALRIAGVNLLQAVNVEYRFSPDASSRRLELLPFTDAAIGWLLGGTGTRAGHAARTSTGLELRFRLPDSVSNRHFPLAGETIRIHYAMAPWLAAGGGRRAAWGWALGSLF